MDDETFDNWVGKFDLLCEEKFKVGLIGSMFFAGVITGTLFIPALADAFGRKLIVIIAFILALIGQLGLILTNNLYEAYVYQFLIGSSFAGRIIVALNYALEFNIKRWHEIIITWLLISEACGTIVITIWYQFIDRGWFLLQLICLIVGILCLLYVIFVVPESPKWLYI